MTLARFALEQSDASTFEGIENTMLGDRPLEVNFRAGYPLFLIREAWNRGMNVEDLADGFGEGAGLASEGYAGGYRDALDDVLLALDGVPPQNRGRGWWSR